MKIQAWRGLSLAVLLLSGAAGAVHAQADYPARAIRMVVANPPGGQTDLVARLMADKLGPLLGQAVIVENRPGANSNLGAAFVARSAPDGYTLIVCAINNCGANPALIRNMPFDPVKDLKAIAQLTSTANVLVVNKDASYRTLPDLLAYARANPGKLSYGSAGLGSSMHLFMELLKSMAKVDILHVPYQGSARAVTDLMGGTVSMVFDSMPGSWPLAQSGQVRAVAVSSARRVANAPDVPTVAESGVPGFEAESWLGLAAPAGTPDAVVQKLNAAVNQVLQMPDVRARIDKMGARPVGGSSAESARFIQDQVETWKRILSAAGIEPG